MLRVTDKYFHKNCFQCIKCNKSLAVGGFFSKDSNYYCVADYQKTFGTKCAVCQQYVEGEVVSTMGNTYHQKCFTCTKCNQPFESGSKVINTTVRNDRMHFKTLFVFLHKFAYLMSIFLNTNDFSKGHQHRKGSFMWEMCRGWPGCKPGQTENHNSAGN